MRFGFDSAKRFQRRSLKIVDGRTTEGRRRPLRKHVHAIYCNIHGCKNDNFQMKIFDIFLIFAQNTDCGYTLEPPQRADSNEYPQSMFWSKNKKNMYTRVNPLFLYKSGV